MQDDFVFVGGERKMSGTNEGKRFKSFGESDS